MLTLLALVAGALLTTACLETGEPAVKLTPTQRVQLEQFIASAKFAPDDTYVGFNSHDVVADPDAVLNGIARRVLERGSFAKQAFLNDAITALDPFYTADTEDRERAYAGVERIMEILGIKSSDRRFNRAMYGLSQSDRLKR